RPPRRAFLSAMPQDSAARPPCPRLLRVSRPAAKAERRRGRSRAAVSRAEPAVPPGLFLQRDAGGTAREPRALVVPQRRVSDAQEPDRARRVPARPRRTRDDDRRGWRGSRRRGETGGAARAARRG